MLNKEINHNKGELGYVPEPLLKRYHKTSKVSIEIYHTTCALSKQIKYTPKHPRITSNMEVIFNSMYVHRIWENECVCERERAYLGSKLNASMENKVSLITSINNFHIYHREQLKSAKYRTIPSFESISEKISRMSDHPPRSWLILHELILWIPLFGIMKFVHACRKSRKSWK